MLSSIDGVCVQKGNDPYKYSRELSQSDWFRISCFQAIREFIERAFKGNSKVR